ncbi:MAG: long-chain fatty acid--CoA ligase, partial [Hyphomonadaceae bacterium]|nr:long-chain fatty acid--CoA ligase [Hyphomonadaceae bacterium]
MFGLMQDWPLTVDKVLDHAKQNFPRREIVTRSVETGALSRSNYGTVWRRAKQVSNALRERGVRPGD